MSQQETCITITTGSAEQTEKFGAKLGRMLQGGDLITLSGELGGGKTCFVRGVVSSLAPAVADQVASPTYALMHEYAGELPIFHFDCYRLRGADDAFELGMQEYLQGNGICLIEWPERIGDELPSERLEIIFEHQGDDQRLISIIPHGDHASSMVEKLRKIA